MTKQSSALKADDNPLDASAYQTAGDTISCVTTVNEYYKTTIEYVNVLGTINAPDRTAHKGVICMGDMF